MTDTPRHRYAARDLRAIAVFVAVGVAFLAADLALKSWSFANVAGAPVTLDADQPDRPDLVIPHHDAQTLVPYVLSLKLWTNTGAVFGIGKGGQGFFMIVSVIATAFILFTFARSDRDAWLIHVSLAMILAGAIGNLYDRMQFNAVRDMLWLFPGIHLPFGLTWPGGSSDLYPWLFNIADAGLVIGVAVLLILMWRQDDSDDAKADEPSES